MVTYQDNDPKGWGGDPRRGAALGRSDRHLAPCDWCQRGDEPFVALNRRKAHRGPLDALFWCETFEGKLVLRRVRLDVGGYDVNGTYFGTGERGEYLYWYASDDGSVDAVLRAESRADAKAKILTRYPKARFFR